MMRALVPLLLVLAGCQSVTVTTQYGTKVKAFNTGDFGNIPMADATGSAGGLNSIITGDVSTKRSSAFAETSPGYMRITAPDGSVVEVGGVVNNSTMVARHWDGATSMLRNWVARLVAGDLFDAFNTKNIESEKTERNKQNTDAAVDVNRSRDQVQIRKIDAKNDEE